MEGGKKLPPCDLLLCFPKYYLSLLGLGCLPFHYVINQLLKQLKQIKKAMSTKQTNPTSQLHNTILFTVFLL